MCKLQGLNLSDDKVFLNANLKDYLTFKVDSMVKAIIEPTSVKELIIAVKYCNENNYDYKVIGNGSNILPIKSSLNLIVITTKKICKQAKKHKGLVTFSAGTYICEAVLWCKNKGLSILEKLYGLPATIGGAVVMNAGAFGGEIFDKLVSIKVLENGKVKTLKKSQMKYSHHNTSLIGSGQIVLSATFSFEKCSKAEIEQAIKDVLAKRRAKQPKGYSAGSVFKCVDNIPAGKIIEDAGLKGTKVNDAVISTKHANFILNNGNATYKDIKILIELVESYIKKVYNIELKREIEYLGEQDDSNRRLPYSH